LEESRQSRCSTRLWAAGRSIANRPGGFGTWLAACYWQQLAAAGSPIMTPGLDIIVVPPWQELQQGAAGWQHCCCCWQHCWAGRRPKSQDGNRQLLQPPALLAKTVSTDRINNLRMVHISGQDILRQGGAKVGQATIPHSR
jgi:hypothetical protein